MKYSTKRKIISAVFLTILVLSVAATIYAIVSTLP